MRPSIRPLLILAFFVITHLVAFAPELRALQTGAGGTWEPAPRIEEEISVGPVVSQILKLGATMAPDDCIGADGRATGAFLSGCPRGQGVFSYARDFLRNLAYMVILTLFWVNLGHGMIKNRETGEILKETVIRTGIVLILLRWYHAYDQVLWYGVSIRVATVFQSSDMASDMIAQAVGLPQGEVAFNRDGNDNDDVTSRFFDMISGPNQIGTIAERDPESADLDEICNQSPEVRASCIRLLEAQMATIEAPPDSLSNEGGERAVMRWLFPNIYAIADWVGDRTEDIRNALANFSNMAMRTWIGIIIGIFRVLVLTFLWFVWLGIVFARALSLTLAPIAFALAMIPGGWGRVQGWFTGHTKLIFIPAAYSFGFLLFYAFIISILASPGNILGSGLVGIALQSSFLLIFIILCFKMKDVLGTVATDVTQVAADFGNAAKDMAIKGAVIAGAAVTGGATMAAGAAATQAAGGGNGAPGGGGGIRQTSTGGTGTGVQQLNQQMSDSVVQSVNPDAPVKVARTPGWRANAVAGAKATKDLTIGRLTQRVKSAVDKVAESPTTAAKDLAKAGIRTTAKGLNLGARMALDQSATGKEFLRYHDKFAGGTPEERKKQRAEDGKAQKARLTTSSLDQVSAHTEEIEHAREEARKAGREFKMPTRRAGEVFPRYTSADMKIEARTQEEADAIQNLWKAGDDIMVHMKQEFRNGQPVAQLSNEAQREIISRMGKDTVFAKLIQDEAVRNGVELQQTADGIMAPDLQELVERSTVFAKAMTLKAQETMHVERELIRREKRTRLASSAVGSVPEIVARELKEDVLNIDGLGGRTDTDRNKYTTRVVKSTLRLAWAHMQKDPRLGAEGGKLEIAGDSSMDIAITNADWTKAGFMGNTPNAVEVRAALEEAKKDMATYFSTNSEWAGLAVLDRKTRRPRWGTDQSEYRRTLGDTTKYIAEVNSAFDIALGHILSQKGVKREDATSGHHRKAFEQSFKEALRTFIKEAQEAGQKISDDIVKAAAATDPRSLSDAARKNLEEFVKSHQAEIHEVQFTVRPIK